MLLSMWGLTGVPFCRSVLTLCDWASWGERAGVGWGRWIIRNMSGRLLFLTHPSVLFSLRLEMPSLNLADWSLPTAALMWQMFKRAAVEGCLMFASSSAAGKWLNWLHIYYSQSGESLATKADLLWWITPSCYVETVPQQFLLFYWSACIYNPVTAATKRLPHQLCQVRRCGSPFFFSM